MAVCEAPPEVTEIDLRLEACWPLIRSATWRWASHQRWDHEDLIQEAALAVWRVLQGEARCPPVIYLEGGSVCGTR